MRILRKTMLIGCTCFLGWPLTGLSQEQDDQNGELKQALAAIATSIQQYHYSPAPFNDELSEKWWKAFFKELDPLKQFFQQSDLLAFRKYRTQLDDELRGEKEPRFLTELTIRYHSRIKEAREDYNKILQTAFRFDKDEYIRHNASPADAFAKNGKSLAEYRRLYLKYLVLQKLVQLQEKDSLARNEAILEAEARSIVAAKLDKWLSNKTTELSHEKLSSLYLNCFTHLLDPHTTYMSATDAKKFRDRMSNKMAGIGVALTQDEDGAKIVKLESTNEAARNGLELNDVIIRLGEVRSGDMTELAGLSSAEIANMIRGEKGTSIKLEVRKPGGRLVTVVIQRREIDQQDNAVKALLIRWKDKKIGLINFPVFYQDVDPFGPQVAADVAQAIQSLREKRADAILFDLRRNGGGSLQEVTRMVSLLIKDGPVVQVRDKDAVPVQRSKLDVILPFGNDPLVQQIYDGPVAVLVDGFSASASEIFAAAIQDYKRGIIIGSASTHGKGTVQRGVPLGNGSLGTLNITVSQFYRVNGASTQQKGVIPDIVLPDLNACLKSREKDLPSSLPWDMVAPAKFETWNGQLNLDALQRLSQSSLANDAAFSSISRTVERSCMQATKDIPLKMGSYKKMLNEQAAIAAETARALHLPPGKELRVELLYPIRNEAWLNSVCKDIYLSQAVAIAAAM